MPTWNIPQPSPEQPDPEVMGDWIVVETPAGDKHAIGCVYVMGGREGRVTSPITDWDPANATLTTRSGRRYRLHGTTGLVLDGAYVRNRWLAREGLNEVADLTRAFWSQIKEAGGLDERGFLTAKR